MSGKIWTRGWEKAMEMPALKRWMVRSWYEYFSTLDRDSEVRLMNYGYAFDEPVALLSHEEPSRYAIQLYHHVASQIDLRELDVLEVGSGRGGGAAYLTRTMQPRTYTGVDLTSGNVSFSKKNYRMTGLKFIQGDAENLDFPDSTFDALINIESSSHYGDIEKFFRQVKRVLRPGGFFLYADIWTEAETPLLYRRLASAGLELISSDDMAWNVWRAMDLDDARRAALIERYVPRMLHGALGEFAGTRGSEKYEMFRTGYVMYLRCLLQVPGPTAKPWMSAHPDQVQVSTGAPPQEQIIA
jgi:SAM-dependent methyltransferase